MKHTALDFTRLSAMPVPAALQHDALKTVALPALGLALADASAEQAVAALLAPGRRRAFFMNAHCCNVLAHDPDYRQAVAAADLLLPDGIGVELAAKMTGDTLTANLNGTDLIPQLLTQAAQQGKTVFLFGGTPGTADAAAEALVASTPQLQIAGTRDGYDGATDPAAAIDAINASGADIVLVALGVPMQEMWIHNHAHRLDAALTLGVGAALDFFAGNVTRAPALVRRARMEWVWRLAMEPRRMARRYLTGNVTFLARAARRTAAHKIAGLPAQAVPRRILDISVAATALVLLAPLLALTALAVKAESRGPVLFRQTRVGKDGRPFEMLKFRSMQADAETRRSTVLESSDREGLCFKAKNDPRITRVGRLIRRFSIDELPQFLNVLRGEMALVGPRPALPSEVAAYPARAHGRHVVKPGITGLWQVSGRAEITFDRMIDMDLSYAASRTILLDLVLIGMTFRAVFSGRGAY